MTDRPTFSENWHRVAEVRPRLRAAVQTYRQRFRGRTYHVVADGLSDAYFRMDEPSYQFVALLDGRRTVEQAWSIVNEKLGDAAPTQGEVIRLLGRLYTQNLLRAELPPDAEQMFERHRRRRQHEVGGFVKSFLFMRIPLLDPSGLLRRMAPVGAAVFSPAGFAAWVLLIVAGVWSLAGRFDALLHAAQPQVLLARENLIALFVVMAAVKLLHELGHGLACVHFGRREGVGGSVHTMGVMLLVLMPLPYVDASSAWAFRGKWRRVMVGAAGMYVELAVAAAAAIVWASTSPAEAPLVNAVAFNVIFVASVTTLLFNANPLMRFDGYYMLSDALELANLMPRSQQYLRYLVKRYLFGARGLVPPANVVGERLVLVGYAVASMVYRVALCIGIVLFLAGQFFVIGAALALAAAVMWGLVPPVKVAWYLLTSRELEQRRGRALATAAVIVAVVVGAIGFVPMPDRGRASGVVEPVRMAELHSAAAGVIERMAPTGAWVSPRDAAVVTARNRELELQRREVEAQLVAAERRLEVAKQTSAAAVQAAEEKIAAVRERLGRVKDEIESLRLMAPLEGVWVSRDAEALRGAYLARGQHVGLVADPSELIVRVTASQAIGPRIAEQLGPGAPVELRVQGRADIALRGTIVRVLPAGTEELPSAALGYAAGGAVATTGEDDSGRQSTEPFFEVHIRPELGGGAEGAARLRIGQRLVARFTLGSAPLAVQWWRAIRQMLQHRFAITA